MDTLLGLPLLLGGSNSPNDFGLCFHKAVVILRSKNNNLFAV